MPESFILGFDPGGAGDACDEGHFGWSICKEADGQLQPPAATGLATDAWDAINQVRVRILGNSRVLAAGIDAPLFWSRTGSRQADAVLRRTLSDNGFPASKVGGTVQAVNSLQGACSVQGMLLTKYLSETWDLTITESHPTALRHLLDYRGHRDMVMCLTAGLADYEQDPARCLCGCWRAKKPTTRLADHERDATLSAVSAWAAIRPNLPDWQNLYVEEPYPIQPFNIPVSYWMPA